MRRPETGFTSGEAAINYYSHHIGDYRRDTAHLSLLEHGIYRQLLDMYYLSEEKITAETEVVFRRLCARTDKEKKAVETILNEFFRFEDGWVQTRCDREILEYRSKAERARLNGKLGGRPPKTKEVISGLSEETDDKANQEPITINQEPLKEKERGKKRFAPPSLEEVSAYCAERNNSVNPQTFIDFYGGKGWMVGKNRMKDWKACVRTWEQRENHNDGQHQKSSKPSLAERATAARVEFEKVERCHGGARPCESLGADDPHLRPPLDIGIR